MTHDKALKIAIRARMAETGEPYSEARRAVLAGAPAPEAVHGLAAPEGTLGAGEDDYYERYLREAKLSGARAEELGRLAADRAQDAADAAQEAADTAHDIAGHAEEEAEEAEARADLAQEAAELAHEWADAKELAEAQERADVMRQRAERVREQAEHLIEAAEQAQDRADRMQEVADDASESEPDEDFGWHGQRMPRPPGPPRPPHPPRQDEPGPWDGPPDFMHRLGMLEERFAEAQDRLAAFLNRLTADRDQG